MFRFTIRDVLWLTVVAAVLSAWWWHGRQDRAEISRLRTILALEEDKSDPVRFLVERSRQSPDPIEQIYAARAAELELRVKMLKDRGK